VLAVSAVVVVVVGAVLALNRSQQTLITPTNSVSAHDADAAGPASGTAEAATLRPWEPLGVIPGAAAAGTSQQQGGGHTLVPAVACSPKPSPSPTTPVAAASATPTPTASPTDSTPATPTPTPSVTTPVVVTPTPTDSSVGTSGSAATSATQAAFIIPDATQLAAGTGCAGMSAKATPKASPTATATS
jgi:hypothetical protein